MIEAGHIVCEGGHVCWRCPNCKQKLGEIIGDRIIIRVAGLQLSIAFRSMIDQTCPRCGKASAVDASVAA